MVYVGDKDRSKGDVNAVEDVMVAGQLRDIEVTEGNAWGVLEQMGLCGHEDLPTKYLSQGQKRRVVLAQMMISNAKLWILDEPFVALDKGAVAHLQELIEKHVGQGGMVVMTTHQEVRLTEGDVRQLQLGVGDQGHA